MTPPKSKIYKIEIINHCKRSGISHRRALELSMCLFGYFKNTRALKRACGLKRAATQSVSSPHGPPALTLVFLGAREAQRLNETYRKKNYATDVLSFSPRAAGGAPDDGRGQGLGDLVFCVPVLKRQAREHGLSLRRELDYLLIHGFLHLLGYEHETSRAEEVKMLNLQDRLFEKFNAKT